jgi:hypothetical protein
VNGRRRPPEQAIERQMRSLSPEMRRALTHDNVAALYGLP